MTIYGLGKLTPIQLEMIALSGVLIREFYPDADGKSFSDTERIWSMKRARYDLARLTGEDFGYDLSEWHTYLTTNADDYGYTHPYGWTQTERIVVRRISDPETKRLAFLAEPHDDEIGWHRHNAPSVERLHPQIRVLLANLRNEIPKSDTTKYLDAENAYNILVAMTGADGGFDADKWESMLVTGDAT